MPSLLLESILGLLSSISNIEAAESLALLVSGANALVWETPTADIVKAKKTYKKSLIRIGIRGVDERKEITAQVVP